MAVIQSRQRSNPQKPHEVISVIVDRCDFRLTANQEKTAIKQLVRTTHVNRNTGWNMLRGNRCIQWNRQTADIITEASHSTTERKAHYSLWCFNSMNDERSLYNCCSLTWKQAESQLPSPARELVHWKTVWAESRRQRGSRGIVFMKSV